MYATIYLFKNKMTLVSDIPILKLAFDAEEKHGEDTHMVIEVVLKEGIPESKLEENEVTTDDVLWWVEFEGQQKIFDEFASVEHFLLQEAEKTYNGEIENEPSK
jgi:hypothetical protein